MAGKKKSDTTRQSSVDASGLISGGAAVGLALFTALIANSIALGADWVATGELNP